MKIQHSRYLLLLFPVIVFLFFYFYLNFDGLYGQDAYEYLRYSKAIRNYLITGQSPGDYLWPLFYPILGALVSLIIQNTGISLLLISTLSLSISAFYLSKILYLIFNKTVYNVLYVFTFFLVSPIIFKSGLLVMSDMLTLCFIILFLYHFLEFSQNRKVKHFYYITIFSFAAFMTRYASAVVLLPFVISATVLFLKQRKNTKHVLSLMLIIVVLFLPHILIRMQNTVEFLSHQWMQDWSILNLFKRNFTTIDGSSKYNLPNIIYVFFNLIHPKFLFVGLIFIPLLFFKKSIFTHSKTIVISVLLYAVFLAGIPFQNLRFLILSFPLVLILFYPIFSYLTELKCIKKLFYLVMIFTITFQFFLIKKTFHKTLHRNQFEIKMVSQLESHQQNTLYSFDIDIALQGRGLQFNYKNLWQKKYNDLQHGDLILFHPTKFIKQWQGKNPILNFDYFNEKYTLEVIENLPQGWQLYKVASK